MDASMDQCIDTSMYQSMDALPIPVLVGNCCVAAVQCPILGPLVPVHDHCRNDEPTFLVAYYWCHTKLW